MTKDEILAYVPPAAKMLGREVVEIDQVNGGAVLRFRALPEFLNRHGTVQGGILCAMLDDVTAFLVTATLGPAESCATLNLNVSFLRAAKAGTLQGRARLERRGKDVCNVSGDLLQAGKMIATATATCMVVRRG